MMQPRRVESVLLINVGIAGSREMEPFENILQIRCIK